MHKYLSRVLIGSTYVCMYICTYVRMCICTYVHMYVCTYVRMYVFGFFTVKPLMVVAMIKQKLNLIVIKGPLRGQNNMATPSRPIAHPGVFSYYQLVISQHGLPDRGTHLIDKHKPQIRLFLQLLQILRFPLENN
jgi:hypothetical protein